MTEMAFERTQVPFGSACRVPFRHVAKTLSVKRGDRTAQRASRHEDRTVATANHRLRILFEQDFPLSGIRLLAFLRRDDQDELMSPAREPFQQP